MATTMYAAPTTTKRAEADCCLSLAGIPFPRAHMEELVP
jgi:hypothetical protein